MSCLALSAPAAEEAVEPEVSDYFRILYALSKTSVPKREPAAPCERRWQKLVAGGDFVEFLCPAFKLSEDFPKGSALPRLHLLAHRGAAFGVEVNQKVESWHGAIELVERLRSELPASFRCELAAERVARCTNAKHTILLSSAGEAPVTPVVSLLFVRDAELFLRFQAAQSPARPGP